MSTLRIGSAVGLAAIAFAVAVMLQPDRPASDHRGESLLQSKSAQGATQSALAAPMSVGVRKTDWSSSPVSARTTSEVDAPEVEITGDEPELVEYRRYRQYQSDIRSVFDATRNGPDPALINEARRLARQTRWAEENEFLLPVEAFGVQAGLLRATVADPDELASRISALQRHYVAQSERERALVAKDPRVAEYQHRAAALVAGANAEPNGDSALNQQKLKQRLTALRRDTFTN